MNVIVHNTSVFDIFYGDEQYERCGVMLGLRSSMDDLEVFGIAEVPNSHVSPRYNFRIDKKDMEPFDDQWPLRILGFVHTHWRLAFAGPSYDDVVNSPEHYLGCIYHTPTGRATFYNNKGYIVTVETR